MLCLAPDEGLGIDDPEMRARIGEDKITLFRRHGACIRVLGIRVFVAGTRTSSDGASTG